MLRRVHPTEQLSAILLDSRAETASVNGACAALYELFVSAATVTADAAHRHPEPQAHDRAGPLA